jgi:hypothetical protein
MKPDTIWPNIPGSAPGQPAASAEFRPGRRAVHLRQHQQHPDSRPYLAVAPTAPTWFFVGDINNPVNYRVTLQQHLRTYITAVMQHFPNVYAWDVVNEVATDTPNATNPYRTDSPWYIAYSNGGGNGADYVRDAFQIAADVRASMGKNSGNMKLMLNDSTPSCRANGPTSSPSCSR